MSVRKSAFKIESLLLNRNSPRKMSGEKISKRELMPLFEAARWAPSSYNAQLWRYIYTLQGSAKWEKFLCLLESSNRDWAKNASALIVVITRKKFEYNEKLSRTAEFDTGASCQNFALEGFKRGLVVHLLEGFNYLQAAKLCNVPNNYKVLAMIVVGKKSNSNEELTKRRPLNEIVMENQFKN